MSAFIILLGIIVTIILIYYNWTRRNLYLAARKYNGPIALPIIGNGLHFLCHSDEIFNKITKIISEYESPLRFWLGPKLVLMFTSPTSVEKILTSSKLSYKSDLYDFLKPIGGEGLITATGGPLYRSHRKVIQPTVNLKWCESTLEIIQKHIDKCMDILNGYVDKGTFDILEIIQHCFGDIVSETMLGLDLNSQNGDNLDYVKSYKILYDVFYIRMVKPWYRSDLIFNMSHMKKDESKCIELARGLMKKAILGRKNIAKKDDFRPLIDEIQQMRDENPEIMNEEDFISHLATLYAASEDTLTSVISTACVCFGMYPQYQKIAAEEVLNSFSKEDLSMESLKKLSYVDKCLKDSLRLAPIACLIAREVREDGFLDEYPLPKGATLVVPIVNLHYDEKNWQNPRHFHPDHFLPENVEKRHPYAYVPFSAGPRNCIGKLIAKCAMQMMMANILKNFEIEADGKFPDLKLKADISLRLRDGYNVRLKRRKSTF